MSKLQTPCVGEVLNKLYLSPLKLKGSDLAKMLNVDAGTLSRLINNKSNCSVEMAYRLGKVFDKTPEYWLSIQMKYDISLCKVDLDKVKKLEV